MSKFVELTEVIKNWAEIVAILLAGVWAFFTFVIKDSPSLRQAVTTNTEVSISSLRSDSLSAYVQAYFKNVGQQTTKITGAKIEYWIVPTSEIISSKHFLGEDFFTEDPYYSVAFSTMNGIYTTDQEYNQGIDFFLKEDINDAIIVRTSLYISRRDVFCWSSNDTLYSYWSQLNITETKD